MLDPRIMTVVRWAAGGPASAASDAVLVERFADKHDEAAFTELVARHGPAVWTLCRRLLRSEPDAEDAFQATFLVLARRAGEVRKAASVGSWLHGVAFRLSRRLRQRPPLDAKRVSQPEPPPDPADSLTWAEVRAALDEELARLPDNLRAPLLLCYFRGLTQDEAAAELGWKPRTLKARVARGRDLLRRRLTRRGIELPAALAAPLLASELSAAVPRRVVAGLIAAAVNGSDRLPRGVSVTAVELARTGMSAVTIVRIVALAISAVALVTAGTVFGLGGGAAPQATAPIPAKAAPGPADPLPAGAIARIGTTQLRPGGWFKRVFFTGDGKKLISVGVRGGSAIEWWDPVSGRILDKMDLPQANFSDADFDAATGLLAVIGGQFPDNQPIVRFQMRQTLWLIDTRAKTVVHACPMQGTRNLSGDKVRIMRDGKQVVTADDGEVRVWNAETGDELIRQSIKREAGSGYLAVSPDGKTIAFGRYNINVWRWQDGKEPTKIGSVGRSGSELFAFAPDGKALFIQPLDGNPMRMFDVSTGRQIGTFDAGYHPDCLSFSPDGKTLAAGYAETYSRFARQNTVTLWDVASGKELRALSLGQMTARAIAWSRDGSRLAAGTNSRLWAWDVASGQALCATDPGHDATIRVVAYDRDGTLFTASDDCTVRSWDPATGKAKLTLPHDYAVYGLAISPDGSLVAGSGVRGDLRVWDARSGAIRFRLPATGTRIVRNLCFTADGSRLISWGNDETLRVWEMRTGKLSAETFLGEKSPDLGGAAGEMAAIERFMTTASAINADGTALAVASRRIVRVYDVQTAKEQLKLDVADGGLPQIAFSPDGKRIAIAQQVRPVPVRMPDGSTQTRAQNHFVVALWDLASRQQIWDGQAEGWRAIDIGFTPDGTRLAALSDGQGKSNSVQVWEAATGKDIGRLDLPMGSNHFAFDNSGKRIAFAMPDTTVLVFNVDSAIKPPAPQKQ
jgi:RNA polymerase sigma factor (sigma-70 family)